MWTKVCLLTMRHGGEDDNMTVYRLTQAVVLNPFHSQFNIQSTRLFHMRMGAKLSHRALILKDKERQEHLSLPPFALSRTVCHYVFSWKPAAVI